MYISGVISVINCIHKWDLIGYTPQKDRTNCFQELSSKILCPRFLSLSHEISLDFCWASAAQGCTATNCCGVHIHVGKTCSVAADIGGGADGWMGLGWLNRMGWSPRHLRWPSIPSHPHKSRLTSSMKILIFLRMMYSSSSNDRIYIYIYSTYYVDFSEYVEYIFHKMGWSSWRMIILEDESMDDSWWMMIIENGYQDTRSINWIGRN